MKRHSAPPAVHVRVHEQEEVTGDTLWFVEDTRETAVPESPQTAVIYVLNVRRVHFTS